MKTRILYFLMIVMLLSSCAQQATQPPTATVPPATNTPLPTDTPVPTLTPTPTETPTPVPTNTPTPTATPNKTATAAVLATQTQTALVAQFTKEMADYEITLDKGNLIFYDKYGTSITMDAYGQSFYDDSVTGDINVANFIIKVDIAWESKTGLAGCGIIFRSDSNISKGDQYTFETLRLSGVPAWDIIYNKLGKFNANITGIKYSNQIDLKNGAVNTYVIVADGSKFTIYANGGKMGSAENKALTEGILAFMGFQESGQTTCTFSNIWVWQLP